MAGTAPTPTPSTFADGQTLTHTQLNSLGTNITTLFTQSMGGFRTKKPICKINRNANLAIANNLDTLLSFTTEIIDTDNMWTSGSTINITTAGWYRLATQIHWDTGGTGRRACQIMVNGTSPSANSVASDNKNPCASEGTVTFCQNTVALSAGAIVRVNVYQNAGGSFSVITSFSGCFFFAEWIAPL